METKRKTWLWVLGWIFIFPLPLTLILLKKQGMDKKAKYGIIAAAWVVYVIIGVVGVANNANKPKVEKPKATIATTVETTAEETTEEETTVQPTTKEKRTEPPTEKPAQAPTEAPTPIVFTNYTNVVEAGSNAFVTIQGKPNTEYDIIVTYDSTTSTAQGLENKVSDDNGIVTWEWKVGTNTALGVHSITVRGGGQSGSVTFEVVNRM